MEEQYMDTQKTYYVYILANKRNGTLYTGVTGNLIKRVTEHKEKVMKGFTGNYDVNKLVYYEVFSYINDAIERETHIKTWKRDWKLLLIEKDNMAWNDLYFEITDEDERNFWKEEVLRIKNDGLYLKS
jgi:putative endonuclease